MPHLSIGPRTVIKAFRKGTRISSFRVSVSVSKRSTTPLLIRDSLAIHCGHNPSWSTLIKDERNNVNDYLFNYEKLA